MRVSGVLVAWESRGCGGGASAAGLPASAASAAAFAAGVPGTGGAAEAGCVGAGRGPCAGFSRAWRRGRVGTDGDGERERRCEANGNREREVAASHASGVAGAGWSHALPQKLLVSRDRSY